MLTLQTLAWDLLKNGDGVHTLHAILLHHTYLDRHPHRKPTHLLKPQFNRIEWYFACALHCKLASMQVLVVDRICSLADLKALHEAHRQGCSIVAGISGGTFFDLCRSSKDFPEVLRPLPDKIVKWVLSQYLLALICFCPRPRPLSLSSSEGHRTAAVSIVQYLRCLHIPQCIKLVLFDANLLEGSIDIRRLIVRVAAWQSIS